MCLVPAQANIQISRPINQRSCCCCQVFNPRLTIVIDNWDQIREEISCSNVVQRESIIFASKLDKNLTEFAVEMDQEVIREYLRALSKGFSGKEFHQPVVNDSQESNGDQDPGQVGQGVPGRGCGGETCDGSGGFWVHGCQVESEKDSGGQFLSKKYRKAEYRPLECVVQLLN